VFITRLVGLLGRGNLGEVLATRHSQGTVAIADVRIGGYVNI